MSQLIDSVLRTVPPEWDDCDGDLELVELCNGDPEFEDVRSKMGACTPLRIVRVENPFLWGFYQLRREECATRWPDTHEEDMWHVTDPAHVRSIATNNFDWRLSYRYKFGRGVCFSPSLDHALRYSTKDGAVILARVLVGASYPGGYATRVPPPPCDNTTGWNKNVYVKYNDHEFYPAYVAYL